MKTDEANPTHWFLLARERLGAADVLYRAGGFSYSAVELLQEALERFLKGYLIATGWPLQKIHNLSTLSDAAVERDPRFMSFAELCESLTAQFWEQHYPGGDLADVGADFVDQRRQAAALIDLIQSLVPQLFPHR